MRGTVQGLGKVWRSWQEWRGRKIWRGRRKMKRVWWQSWTRKTQDKLACFNNVCPFKMLKSTREQLQERFSTLSYHDKLGSDEVSRPLFIHSGVAKGCMGKRDKVSHIQIIKTFISISIHSNQYKFALNGPPPTHLSAWPGWKSFMCKVKLHCLI